MILTLDISSNEAGIEALREALAELDGKRLTKAFEWAIVDALGWRHRYQYVVEIREGSDEERRTDLS